MTLAKQQVQNLYKEFGSELQVTWVVDVTQWNIEMTWWHRRGLSVEETWWDIEGIWCDLEATCHENGMHLAAVEARKRLPDGRNTRDKSGCVDPHPGQLLTASWDCTRAVCERIRNCWPFGSIMMLIYNTASHLKTCMKMLSEHSRTVMETTS